MGDLDFMICAILVAELIRGTGTYMCVAYGTWDDEKLYKRALC